MVKLLNASLNTLKASSSSSGDPILSAWISTEGHYAFVEFRSAEEANNGFLLNNISILGQPLKVGRPKTYTGTFSLMEDGSLCNTVAAALSSGTMTAPAQGRRVQFPTRILCFVNIAKGLNIDQDEEYTLLKEDIIEECNLFGRVVSAFVPRKDVDDNPSPGMGDVYCEFQSREEAKEVRRV